MLNGLINKGYKRFAAEGPTAGTEARGAPAQAGRAIPPGSRGAQRNRPEPGQQIGS